MSKYISLSFLFLFALLLIIPFLSFANGGDQRVVDGKYLINLSRAPFTPRVGIKTSMLASFVDFQNSKLIAEDMVVNVRIAKIDGRGADKRRFVYEEKNVKVRGGILELAYTFQESGLHEIFFDFAFVSNPQKLYEAPDFLIDVQKQEVGSCWNQSILAASIVALIIGFVMGKLVRIKAKRL